MCRSAAGRVQYGCVHADTTQVGRAIANLPAGGELCLNYGMHYHLWDASMAHTPFQPDTPDGLNAGFQAFSRWGFIPVHLPSERIEDGQLT